MYFPELFKYLSPRYAKVKKAFDDARSLVKFAIDDHLIRRQNKVDDETDNGVQGNLKNDTSNDFLFVIVLFKMLRVSII